MFFQRSKYQYTREVCQIYKAKEASQGKKRAIANSKPGAVSQIFPEYNSVQHTSVQFGFCVVARVAPNCVLPFYTSWK